MKRAKTIAFAAGTMLLAAHGAIAQAQNTPGVMALTADEMRWSSQGGLALPGMEQVNLIGNPSKPGPYTLRLKFPAGFKLPPHFHPDAREVTISIGRLVYGLRRNRRSDQAQGFACREFLHRTGERAAFCRGSRTDGDPGKWYRTKRTQGRHLWGIQIDRAQKLKSGTGSRAYSASDRRSIAWSDARYQRQLDLEFCLQVS